jgi:hypothetical protein
LKKRLFTILLTLTLLLTLQPAAALAGSLNAEPTNAAVYINGSKVAFEAYTINNSNYFKLRDLAMAFNSTDKKFNVGYDASTNTVEITAGQSYMPTGGELEQGDGTSKTATPGNAAIRWSETSDGKSSSSYNIALGTYVINGNNFVKLRDLMQWLDVGVGYDSKTASISIVTGQGYVLPKYSGNPLAAAEAIDSKYRKDYGSQPGSIQNAGELVYHDGWYYCYGFKVKEGGKAVAYKTDYGDYIVDNIQVYDNRIYFEGADSTGITNQVVFSMNLDGSGLKKLLPMRCMKDQESQFIKGSSMRTPMAPAGMEPVLLAITLTAPGERCSTLVICPSYRRKSDTVTADIIFLTTGYTL